jgi:hypothetical protein
MVPPNIPDYHDGETDARRGVRRNISRTQGVCSCVDDERAVRVLAISGSLRRTSSNCDNAEVDQLIRRLALLPTIEPVDVLAAKL